MFEFAKTFFSIIGDSNVNKQQQKKLYFVCGNEAADLDSIIAATVYSYLSQQLIAPNESTTSSLYFPIIQIPRSDLYLRPECSYVFNQCNFSALDISQLLFLDDVSPHLNQLSSKNYDVNLILVDHNKLISPWDEKFNDKIVAILDHHSDEKLYPYLNDKCRQIETVGSATSLVVLHFKNDWEKKISRDDDENSWYAKLAKLLLAPILVDTILLDESKNRVTNKDREATQFLLNVLKIPISTRENFTSKYFEEIQNVKLDVTHFSNIDLLRKDYKEWDLNTYKIGVSSVYWFLEGWINREDDDINKLIDSFKSFSIKMKLDIFIIMMAYNHKDKGFKREFVFLSKDDKDNIFIRDKFTQQLEKKLQLKRKSLTTNVDHIKFYNQEDNSISRKQLFPLVNELIFTTNL
ncbi:8291_t:CDS:2 [Funneliformis caledonium]|uniref:8291_t:CDS:1 n=1 Tax=Funneliformis caledonium TaxID=1117310 RepID=A0A9N8WN87_9GLOM|nr:8291_t:CDS:2 [Funneliformis caledonium]